MNEIVITNINGELTTSSLGVAEKFGKRHCDVLEKISDIMAEMNSTEKSVQYSAEKSAQYFIESIYIDNSGKSNKCYELTRDGFSLLVMGFTGKKALEWKLKYIEAFNLMEQKFKEQKPTAEDKARRLALQEMNARTRQANMYLKLADIDTLSPEYKNILVAKSAEVLAGTPILPLPESEKTYSAGEIGQLFGVSAQIIGRLANKHNLKTDEFGKWYHDKSPYSSKEVDTFRYNDKAVEKFRDLL